MSDLHSGGSDPHYPADHAIELALLGKILLDQHMNGLEELKLDDFDNSDHREIFKRMKSIWESEVLPLDPYLIADRDGVLRSILMDAAITGDPATPAANYAQAVRELAKKRRMASTLSKHFNMAMNGEPFSGLMDSLRNTLDSGDWDSVHDTWRLSKAATLSDLPSPREWLLEGLIFRGQISMWYGPPGIRKSLLLMDACAAMATGQNWLMCRSWQEDHPTLVTFHAMRKARVLWLDYDNGQFETQIRIRAALSAREGLNDAEFYYMSETTPWLALDNATHVRRVIRLALDVGADVIVIDALGMVLGDVDENSPEAAQVIAKLKEIRSITGAAIIVVHHPSKSGAQTAAATTYNAAGSSKFSNFFEWSIELRAGEAKNTIIASVVKHRGWAKTNKFLAELEYTHFGDEHPELAHELKTFKFYPAAIESAGEKRTATLKSVIMEALAAGEMNQKDLVAMVKPQAETATGTRVGEKSVIQELDRLVKNGDICAIQSVAHRPITYKLGSVDSVGSS